MCVKSFPVFPSLGVWIFQQPLDYEDSQKGNLGQVRYWEEEEIRSPQEGETFQIK